MELIGVAARDTIIEIDVPRGVTIALRGRPIIATAEAAYIALRAAFTYPAVHFP